MKSRTFSYLCLWCIDLVRRIIYHEIGVVISKCLTHDSSKLLLIEEMGMIEVVAQNCRIGQKRGLNNSENHCEGLLKRLQSCAFALPELMEYDNGSTAAYQCIKNIHIKLGKCAGINF